MDSYELWLPNAPYKDPTMDPAVNSSTLFDTVAVYLAADQNLFEMQDLPLRVTDDGYTIVDPDRGRTVHCALSWQSLPTFKTRLADILIG
jgi:hypothetical protein